MPKRTLKPGQVWGNSTYRRTILRIEGGLVFYSDHRNTGCWPVTTKTFNRWITCSDSEELEMHDKSATNQILMSTIREAEGGFWLLERLRLAMRAAVYHLEHGETRTARNVLQKQLEKLETMPTMKENPT